jgi:CoA:oxalate CoA-transferase
MPGALDGIRVIDLTQNLAGPFSSMNLADHGADVIKVEPPDGEATRLVAPFLGGESTPFMMWNRNKRSLTLDLKDEADKAVLLALLEEADILMEAFRPGAMERLGLGYETLHPRYPRLIYGSISGYGASGPMAAVGGFDVMAQGMAGLMAVNGPKDGPPHRLPIPLCDLAAGMFLTVGVLAALEARRRTGFGQKVETSLLEAATALQHYEANHVFTTGEPPPRMGQAHRGIAPYQVFPSSDGYLTIAAGLPKFYAAFCRLAARPDLIDDPRFRAVPDRVANNDALVEILSRATIEHPTRWWIDRLEAEGIPCGPVLNHAELLTHPQIIARRMVEEVDHPTAGRLKTLGVPVKLSETPGSVRAPAPRLGEHSAEIRAQAARGGRA